MLTDSLVPIPGKAAATLRAPAAHHLLQTMEIEVPLQMRNYPRLAWRITQGSPIPFAEMDRFFLPLPAHYAAVIEWLRSEGLVITGTDRCRLAVFARGTVGQINKSLRVDMAEVTVSGREYHTARSHPSIPKRIASTVLGINGLQPYLKAIQRQSGMVPQIASAPPFLTSEIRHAYNADNLGVTGAGQKIAILIQAIASDSDLTAFWTRNGVPQNLGNIEIVNVNNATLDTTSAEAIIDEEWTSGIAPDAKIRVYATGSLDFASLDKGLQRLISDLPTEPELHQLSISLGLGEAYMSLAQIQTDKNYFATIASSGISVFVSSGDAGSNPNASGGTGGATPTVEYYSSDPNVTGVGGTSLGLNQDGSVATETAWNGSGGGVSGSTISFDRPSWQIGAGVPAGVTRCVPDVSLAANPATGYYVYASGTTWQYGGTSLGAPIWAAFCALLNEARAKVSLGPMGLLNPRLYPLLGTPNFRDITSGSNGVYSAGVGYDCVTGLGVPNVAVLLQSVTLPEVVGLNPASGGDGTVVIISGYDFTGATAVTFNGVNALSFSVDSANRITAAAPVGVTTGPISVTTPLGTSTSTCVFTFSLPSVPSVTAFSPASTVVGGTVTVVGSNFTGISGVTFGGIPAVFTVGSNTLLATVPNGAPIGPISVINMAGTGSSASNFVPAAGLAKGTLYFTAFESGEGYIFSSSIGNQNGWFASGSGGNGFGAIITGQGQQATLGKTAPTSGTTVTVWHPIAHTPAPGEVVTFSVLLDVIKSTALHPNRDTFRWTIRNSAGGSLFSINFDNQARAAGYLLDDGVLRSSGITFANATSYTLQVTIDSTQNLWNATLNGSILAANQPVTTLNQRLDLGDIPAVWMLSGTSYGNNYMLFDNYTVASSTPLYSVATVVSPLGAGTTVGAGTYMSGSSVTVTATPSSGYAFSSWTDAGAAVSASASYTFPVLCNRALTATFEPATFSTWAAAHFSSDELANPSVSGLLADPDHDGVPNLLEYAFHSEPLRNDANRSRLALK